MVRNKELALASYCRALRSNFDVIMYTSLYVLSYEKALGAHYYEWTTNALRMFFLPVYFTVTLAFI